MNGSDHSSEISTHIFDCRAKAVWMQEQMHTWIRRDEAICKFSHKNNQIRIVDISTIKYAKEWQGFEPNESQMIGRIQEFVRFFMQYMSILVENVN